MSAPKATQKADAGALIKRAAAHHGRNEFDTAEDLYRQVLRAEPGHFDALHLCGVLMQQRGRSAEALELIGAALAANARVAAAHSNYGLVLAALGRYADALASYDKALALTPDYAEALHNRGNALVALDRYEEALASFDRAIALRPGYMPTFVNRAQVLEKLGRIADALDSVERALTIKPDAGALALRGRLLRALKRDAEALTSFSFALALAPRDADALIARGNTHFAMKSFAAALADYDSAAAVRPDAAPVHNNRGNALRELGRREEALAAFDRAIGLAPGYAEAYNNRGNTELELNRLSEALTDYDRALSIRPDFADALVNRGDALHHLGRDREAIASFDRAIALNPQLAEAHWNKALACLAMGDYAHGFEGYEWRWKREGELKPRDFAQPQWRGEDLNGKTILLHAEQGFGDTIQFIRFLPMVAAKGSKVVLEIPDDLRPLIERTGAVAAFARRGDRLPPFDVHCPLMSLAGAFGTTLDTIPAPIPYLSAPPDRIERWRERLAGLPGRRVGLVWSGKPTHKNDHNRSIPLSLLTPLFAQGGIAFVSLQKDYRDADRAALARAPLLRLDASLLDFADTAAAISSLDLVIAVDTAVAHLVGAMGKPLWLLLPAVGDWRWLTGRNDSPWYPTARLFRQPRPGDWPGVISGVARELALFAHAAAR